MTANSSSEQRSDSTLLREDSSGYCDVATAGVGTGESRPP